MAEKKDEGASEDVIRQRLAVKEVNLRRTLRKLNAFALAEETDNASYQMLLSELAQLELFGAKARTVYQAYDIEWRDYERQCQQKEEDLKRVLAEVQHQKAQLEKEKARRKHMEDCDAIRKSIHSLPSRQASEKEINAVMKEIEALTAEGVALSQKQELRQKQFGSLLHAIHSLQNELEAEDIEEMEKKLLGATKAKAAAAVAASPVTPLAKGTTPPLPSVVASTATALVTATSASSSTTVAPTISVVTSLDREEGEKEKESEDTKPSIQPSVEGETTTAEGDIASMQTDPTAAIGGGDQGAIIGASASSATMKRDSNSGNASEEEEGAVPNT